MGSSLEDFLQSEGMLEAVTAAAVKRVVAQQLRQALADSGLTKASLASRMGTSRAQLDRLLDPDNPSATLETLARAAAALGKRLHVELMPAA